MISGSEQHTTQRPLTLFDGPPQDLGIRGGFNNLRLEIQIPVNVEFRRNGAISVNPSMRGSLPKRLVRRTRQHECERPHVAVFGVHGAAGERGGQAMWISSGRRVE